MLPHEYLNGLVVLRKQEEANVMHSVAQIVQEESVITASRAADRIRQRREEAQPQLEAIDSEIERMTGYCSSWIYKLWVASHASRGFIWMITAMMTLCFLFWAPVNARGQGGALTGPDVLTGIIAALSFIWAIWSSVMPDYQPKA